MALFLRFVVVLIVVMCLISQSVAQDVENQSQSGQVAGGAVYPFIVAVESNRRMELEKLVSQGYDINERNERGLTAAHQAAYLRLHETLGELIRLGANLNAQDNDGWTPLMTAASTGDSMIVQQLLDGNANPLIHSKEHYMAHSYALFANYPHLALRLANAALTRAILTSDFFSMFLALEDGADINTQTLPGATALIVATHAGQTDVVRRLLNVPGIHPDFQEADGWTALMFAAYTGNVDIVHMLLDFGVDLNLQNTQGLTAVEVARQFNQMEIVYVLEERVNQVLQYQVHLAAEKTRAQIAEQEAAALAQQEQLDQARAQAQAQQQAQRAHTTTNTNANRAEKTDAGKGQSRFEDSAKAKPAEPKKRSLFGW